jgi:hypothetical protein
MLPVVGLRTTFIIIEGFKMELEAGKKYLNREGKVVVIRKNLTDDFHPFASGRYETFDFESYTEEGSVFNVEEENKFDLIEEVIETRIGTKMIEINKTYKDGVGGSSVISSRDDYSSINSYPFSGTHTDVNGIVSTRTYTEEGIFNLSSLDSRLNLIVEEVEEEIRFKIDKYYRAKDGSLFQITKIWGKEDTYILYPIEAREVTAKKSNIFTFTSKGSYFADDDPNPSDLICIEIELEEIEESVEEPSLFKVGKHYRSLDGTLFCVTGIREASRCFQYPIEAVEVTTQTERTFTLEGLHYSRNDTGKLNLICKEVDMEEPSLAIVEDALTEAEIEEIWEKYIGPDEVEEDNTFNSVEEIFLWLASGNRVADYDSEEVWDFATFPYAPKLTCSSFWFKYLVPKVVHWYEQIPAKGIICWVWDTNTSEFKTIGLIDGYYKELDYPFRVENCGYAYAKPLTEEELLERFSEGL